MKNFKILFGFVVAFGLSLFTYSCTKDTTSDKVLDNSVELRSSGCDGTPMGAPKVTLEPSPPGLCCFTLQFNPVYIPGSPFQVVGLDSLGNSLATKPNGFCTGTLSNPGYTLTCCITQLAASITISLNPSGPGATCVEIDLPCDN